MDAAEKNRFVLHQIARRLDEEDDFHGRIHLNCKDGRIVHHAVEQTFDTEQLLRDSDEVPDEL
jgi:hypothetical protein